MAEPTPIRARLFPGRIALQNGTVHDTVLVLIGLDRMWVYQNGDNLVYEGLLDDLWGTAKDGYYALVDGQEIKITRGTSCGCGSAYKSGKNPFPIRIAMYPLPKKRTVGV